MNIPMVDLKGQYALLKEDIDRGLREVLETTQFILGPNCRALEEEIAAYCGVKHAIGVASGTDALHLALRAAGIGAGDEVITTPFTFIATAEAISYVGATPVFVDIEPASFNLDVSRIEGAITPRTRAILPVHLFGQPADLEPMVALCAKHDLKLIEDCAQSFGASYGDKKTGAIGDAGCFSFFPSKNLGGFGDGGMVITDDDQLAEELGVLRNHGSRKRYEHAVIGYNSRLDEMQAVILRAKFKHIDRFNALRRQVAHRYTATLKGSALVAPIEDGRGTHVYHQYTLRTDRREALQAQLTATGIACAIYYPIPLHRQEVYAELYPAGSFPHAEAAAREVLSLPIYPELTAGQIDRICEVILTACKE